ncbi:hypothetical protein ACFYNX_26435 [Streptomyces sp. NPDC007872]|uniref:hypothetical protein n=1 Tax=Streptomyces sp. NPDC007872 TaxID=3364782 RepID=UPI0036740135
MSTPTTAATSTARPRPLPRFHAATAPATGWDFTHRGLSFSTYRPTGFAASGPTVFGWSVFWNITTESREEITGGWEDRASAVRAALRAVDQRAEANRLHWQENSGTHPQPARCCPHLDTGHTAGLYGPTRCTASRCRCYKYQQGPLVPIRAEDIPTGAVLALHPANLGPMEFPVAHSAQGTRPGTIDRPRITWIRVVTATGDAYEIDADTTVYALAHTVPGSTPRAE